MSTDNNMTTKNPTKYKSFLSKISKIDELKMDVQTETITLSPMAQHTMAKKTSASLLLLIYFVVFAWVASLLTYQNIVFICIVQSILVESW